MLRIVGSQNKTQEWKCQQQPTMNTKREQCKEESGKKGEYTVSLNQIASSILFLSLI